jgi:hypothetical protein
MMSEARFFVVNDIETQLGVSWIAFKGKQPVRREVL